MRISFSIKVALAIAFVSLLASFSALTYYYNQIRDSVWSEMSRRLRDIGKTGQALFTEEHRQAMVRLDQLIQKKQPPLHEGLLASIDYNDYKEVLPEEESRAIEESPDFRMIVQALRMIKAGTLEEPIFPQPLNQLLNQNLEGGPKSSPTLKYVYLLAPVEESPDFKVVRFIGDSDYQEMDMNGNGTIEDDEIGAPPGLLYNIEKQPRMREAFRTARVQNMDAPDDDAWGTWYTAMIPIKDKQGNLIAVLGLDMDTQSNLNLLNNFYWLAISSMGVIFVFTTMAAYLFARYLASPMDKLREAAQKVQDRKFDTRVNIQRKDELGLLADAFNSMVREIRIYSDQMEDLVAERTARLEESLKQVQKLKDRQDGDYYLSTLLTSPLFKNTNNSDCISTDFLIRQKKRFSFRRWNAELGGDLCVSGNLRFNGSRWVMFFNGDAMGKSMQGAGGALVMGALINSILVRSSANNRDLKIEPGRWMIETHTEIQRIFETFEGSMYVSGVLGIVEESTGKMYYLNAEHPSTVLLRNGKCRFLEEEKSCRKFGMPGVTEPDILEFRLDPGDILIAGSDGRDDIEMVSNTEGRIMNQSEELFLQVCERSGGDLAKIGEMLEQSGDLTDDLSLLRLHYSGRDPVPEDDASRLIKQKRYSRALALLEGQDVQRPLDQYYRGLCLWRLNRADEALNVLMEVEREMAGYGAFLKLLASIHLKMGRNEEARRFALRALDLDSSDSGARRLLNRLDAG